jgi:hypothetical protein
MTSAIPDAVLRHHVAVLGKTGSGKTSTEPPPVQRQAAATQQPAHRPAPKRPALSSSNGNLTGPQLELLAALAWWDAMGHREPTRAQVAAIAGWKVKGSHLRNRLAELSSKGLISYPRADTIALTDQGLAVAPVPDTSRSLTDSINAMLNGPQQEVFAALLNQRRDRWPRHVLAEALGWETGGSHLRNRLAELSAMEIIEYPSRGEVAKMRLAFAPFVQIANQPTSQMVKINERARFLLLRMPQHGRARLSLRRRPLRLHEQRQLPVSLLRRRHGWRRL